MFSRSDHHECQVLSDLRPEAEECEGQWRECKKNPGHLDFQPAPDFVKNYQPKVQNEIFRKIFGSVIDLTVRLRVGYVSENRPDGFAFSDIRGTDVPRVGTGFIWHVSGPEDNQPCECHGMEQRELHVVTALHVVYDDDEALKTVADLYYDDKESLTDGRMKSVRGVKVFGISPDMDLCYMICVTCDKDLIERIMSSLVSFNFTDAGVPRNDLEDLNLQQSCSKYYVSALIVSHPHGQPKQVTVGEVKNQEKDGDGLTQYTTPTCPGSGGAPVILFDRKRCRYIWESTLHVGSCGETYPECCDTFSLPKRLFKNFRGHKQPITQLNFGIWW